MGILIDSTVFFDHERRKLNLADWLNSVADEAVFVSVITLCELWHGCFMAAKPEQSEQRMEQVEWIAGRFQILDVIPAIGRRSAEIRASLQRKGLAVGAHDISIGATALHHQHVVATANLRDFNRIEGLEIPHWSAAPSKQP